MFGRRKPRIISIDPIDQGNLSEISPKLDEPNDIVEPIIDKSKPHQAKEDINTTLEKLIEDSSYANQLIKEKAKKHQAKSKTPAKPRSPRNVKRDMYHLGFLFLAATGLCIYFVKFAEVPLFYRTMLNHNVAVTSDDLLFYAIVLIFFPLLAADIFKRWVNFVFGYFSDYRKQNPFRFSFVLMWMCFSVFAWSMYLQAQKVRHFSKDVYYYCLSEQANLANRHVTCARFSLAVTQTFKKCQNADDTSYCLTKMMSDNHLPKRKFRYFRYQSR